MTDAPTRVLVVEDDRTVAEVVTRYLEREGFAVESVGDGHEALAHADAHLPDLVVLDIMLPGLDGLEVCRRLRSHAPIPVVMLTARGSEEDRVLGLDLGAREARVHGELATLTAREFELLAFLAGRPRQVFRRDELLEHVWGYTYGDTSTVTVHIRRLREKIEDDPSTPRRITTVWGVGYRFDP